MNDPTLRKHGGNAASSAAYRFRVKPTELQFMEFIYTLIDGAGMKGMTNKEILSWLNSFRSRPDRPWALNDFSGRVSKLQDLGKVQARGEKDRRDGATVWVSVRRLPAQMSLLGECA